VPFLRPEGQKHWRDSFFKVLSSGVATSVWLLGGREKGWEAPKVSPEIMTENLLENNRACLYHLLAPSCRSCIVLGLPAAAEMAGRWTPERNRKAGDRSGSRDLT